MTDLTAPDDGFVPDAPAEDDGFVPDAATGPEAPAPAAGGTPAVEPDLPESAFSQAADIHLGSRLDARGNVVPSVDFGTDRYDAQIAPKAERLRKLMTGFSVTTQGGVDRHASVLRLANETGMRFDTANANFDLLAESRHMAAQHPVEWMQANPELTSLLFERPELAPVVVRDHKLNVLSRAWNWAEDQDTAFQNWAGIKAPWHEPLTPEQQAVRDAPKQEVLTEDEQAQETRSGGWELLGTGVFVPKKLMVPGYRFTEAWQQQKISRSGYELLLARGRGDEPAAQEIEARIHDQRLDSVRRNYDEGEAGRVLSSMATAAASTSYGLKEAVEVGGVAGVAAGAATLAVTKNPAVASEALFSAGSLFGKAGAVKGTFELEAGNAYLSLLAATGKDGQPIPEETARTAAAVYGVLAAGVEFASWGPMLKAMGPLGELIKRGEAKAATTAMVHNNAFMAAVKKSASHWLPSAVAEGAEEGIQDALEQSITLLATGHAVGEIPSNFKGQQTVEAVGEGLIGGIGLGGMAVATGVFSGAWQRDRALVSGKVVADLVGLKGSPTVHAAPAAVARMVEHATGRTGEPVTSFHVDAPAFVRLFQEQGGDANQAITDLMGEQGPRLLQEALAQGKRLEVPVATYLERWGGTETAKALAADTSTSATTPTLRDLAEFDKAVKEAAKSVDGEGPASEGEADFIDAAEKQLAKVQGEGQGKARLQMNLWRGFVRAMQERLGGNADAFFRGLALKVEEANATQDVGGNPILGPDLLMQRAESPSLTAEQRGVMRTDEFFRDQNTGILNDEAHKATPAPEGMLAGHVSVEGIKYINDNADHETADLLYRAVAKALHAVDPNVAKVGGDFRVYVKDQAELDAMLQLVRESMPEQLRGFEITGAVGKTYDQAGKTHKALNEQRIAKGERANPRPLHPTLTNEYGQPETTAAEKPKGLKGELNDLVFPTEKAHAEVSAELAKQVTELTPEQYFDKAYRDQKTGEWTARGWAALPRKAYVVSIDVKGLRHVNDTFGPEVGDAMLQSMGTWGQKLGGVDFDFSHLHGDEYAAQSDDPKALEAFVHEVEAMLARYPIGYEDPETPGKLTPIPVEFHHGFGERSLEAADRDLNTRKARFKKARAAGLERRGSQSARSQADVRGPGEGDRASGEQAAHAGEVDKYAAGREAIGRMRSNKPDAEAFLEYVEGKRERPRISPALERLLGRHGIVDPLGFPFDENGRDLRRPMKSQGYFNSRGVGLVGNAADAYANRKVQPMSRAFYATGEQGKAPRGFTELNVTKEAQKLFKVALTEQQDLSTFLHESGHVFLKLMGQAVEDHNAPEQLKADWDTALKWLGADSFEKLTTEQHEKWARGFERYLLEGKAPSSKLAAAFSAFKLWLKGIYRSVAGLNVELTDEVRGVFDRLLATDQELELQRSRMGFTTPTAQDILGYSPAEYAKYLDERQAATEHAALQAEHTAMKETLRVHEKWWREQLKQERQRAEEAYEQLPARIAEQTLKGKGELSLAGMDGPLRLAREDVVKAVGEKNAKRFQTTTKAAEKVSPDEVAQFLGYPTGQAMLEGVLSLPDRAKWVKATAIQAMAEKHGDVLQERQRLAEIVAKGLHGDMTARILAREAAALVTRLPGAAMVPDDVIRAAAKQRVSETTLGKLDPSAALAAERKAANDYAKACAKQNFQQALVFKNRQRLNMYVWRELTAAREMRDDLLALADKLGDRKARYRLGKGHPLFLGGVDLLLESLGLKEPSPREKPLPSLGEVVTELMKFDTVGFDEQVIEGVLARATAPERGWARVDFRTLTVDEAKNVLGAMKNLEAAARDRATVLIDGKRIAKEDAKAKLQQSAAANLPPKPPPPTPGAETPQQWAAGVWNGLDGEMRKPEFMLNRLGGRDIHSPWHQFIVKQLQAAKHIEADLMHKHAEPLLGALKKLAASGRSMEKVDGAALFPGHTEKASVPQRRFELWVMRLNAMNPSNLERLTLGRQITEEQLIAAEKKIGLTDEEAGALQGVVDAFEELGRLSFDLEERDSGLRPEKIEAREWVAPSGKKFRGGYFPAIYDFNVTNVGAKQEAQQLFDPGFVRPGTAHGHLKSRVDGFNDVISLSPEGITRHLAQAVHDLAFRERLKAVANLLLDDDVQQTMRTYLGTGKASTFPQYLRDVGQMRGSESVRTPKLTGLVRWARGNLPAVLGYRMKNAVEDWTTNLTTACIRTGLELKHLAAAVKTVKFYDKAAMADAEARSGELRSRHGQIQRDLLKKKAEFTQYDIPGRKALRWYKDHAFFMQEMADRASSAMVWLAAERQYLEKNAEDENTDKVGRDAVTFADAMVRQVLLSHSPVDASALMRDKGPVGAFLVFFGFFNHAYNRQADIVDQAIDAKTGLDRALAVGGALGFMLAVSAVSGIVRGQGPAPGDEPQDETDPKLRALLKARNYTARKLLVGSAELLPIVGPLGQAVESTYMGKKDLSVRNNTVMGIFEGVAKSYLQAIDENKDPEQRLKAFLRTLEPTLGIPTGQAADTGGFLWDWYQGNAQPRGPGDVLGGLYAGKRQGQGGNLGTMGQDLYEAIRH